MKKPLIILTGPTAAGKTDLSVLLAKKLDGAIISADSMQVYKYMDIGSAKIKTEEMQGVDHYLIDEFMPDEEFNVVKFKQYAKQYIEKIYQDGKIPIIVGGTGFYIQAVLYDINFTEEEKDDGYREQLEEIAKTQGGHILHEMLKQVDEEAAAQIHENNKKRIIRALEYNHQTGEKISAHNEKERQKTSPYNFAYFVLNDDRNLLYEKINRRVDQMLEQGLVQEVEQLKNMGYHRDMVSMQGLGYKEILDYLDGTTTLEEAVYLLKRDTRHFAKRQITWFKREKDVLWINKPDFHYNNESIITFMIQKIGERLRNE